MTTAHSRGEQISPDTRFLIEATYAAPDGSTSRPLVTTFGFVCTASSQDGLEIAGMTIPRGVESWYFDLGLLMNTMGKISSLTFTSLPKPESANYLLPELRNVGNYLIDERAPWEPATAWSSPGSDHSRYIFKGADSLGNHVYLELLISPTEPSSISWYLPEGMSLMVPTGAFDIFNGPFPQGGLHVSSAQLTTTQAATTIVTAAEGTSGLAANRTHLGVCGAGMEVRISTQPQRWLLSASTKRIHLYSNPSLVLDVDVARPGQVYDGAPVLLNYVDYSRPSQQWTATHDEGHPVYENGDTDSTGSHFFLTRADGENPAAQVSLYRAGDLRQWWYQG
ncbi:MAG: hypothetical protein R3B70_45510 [Polyangiaceae bacterium]